MRSDRRKAEARLGWYLAGPAFIIMLAVTLYPILLAFFDSLFAFRLTTPDEREFIWFANYITVLSDPVWWRDFGVTVAITVITVAVELVLGFALALVMHKAIKSLRGLLRTAILVPYGIITVVSAYAWFYAFDISSGYINSWFGWLPFISPDLQLVRGHLDRARCDYGLRDLEDDPVHLAAAAGRTRSSSRRIDRGG